jgi:hypothetical protein
MTFCDEARKVAEGATPGPWRVRPTGSIYRGAAADAEHGYVKVVDGATFEEPADAALIAFMRNHWDAMVDVVEAAEAYGAREPAVLTEDYYVLCEALDRLGATTKEGE